MLKKIGNFISMMACPHPEHKAPDPGDLPPGIYAHTCPQCAYKCIVHVSPPKFPKKRKKSKK